jgi:hypothetical protein
MEITSPLPQPVDGWGQEALALVQQAKVLSGAKIEQLVLRLQRQTGRSHQDCWRFVIKYGIKGQAGHRRWRDEELDLARELLTKYSVQDVAKKLRRSPNALRNALQRKQLSVRQIRCDCFSAESLAQALHVRRSEIVGWVETGWLEAEIIRGRQGNSYRITPEALSTFYKCHLHDLLKRRIPNLALFEAYVQYCFSPKHTIGGQLLDVRRDKQEREAFAASQSREGSAQHDPDEDEDLSEA